MRRIAVAALALSLVFSAAALLVPHRALVIVAMAATSIGLGSIVARRPRSAAGGDPGDPSGEVSIGDGSVDGSASTDRLESRQRTIADQAEQVLREAEARRAGDESAELQRALLMLTETGEVLSALADTAIDKSRRGSTALADDIYQIAEESKSLGRSIATFLTRLSTGDASLQHGLDELDEDNRRLNAVREIFDQTDRSLATSIERVGSSVSVTSELLGQVTEIAEQTSILAINAAIYAAKAGDHGRGFSVIASEIQRLASTSKEVARAIGDNTKAIEHHVAEFTARHHQLMRESRAGLETISESLAATIARLAPEITTMGASIRQASSLSESMTEHVSQASMAMQEQDAIQQIVGHMVDIFQTTAAEAIAPTREEAWRNSVDETVVETIRKRVRQIAASCFSMKDEFDAIEHDGYASRDDDSRVVLKDGSSLEGDITLF